MALSPTPLTTGTINSVALTDFNAIVNLLNAAFPLAAANIGTNAVETLKIKDGNVTAGKLATDAVETLKIKDGNVTAGKLATDAVETLKIKDANVTLAKLANIAAGTMLGNNTANAAAPIALEVGAIKTLLGLDWTTLTTATLAVSTLYTMAHGLGAMPTVRQWSLLCDQNDNGWLAGNEIILNPNYYASPSHYNFSCGVDATNFIMYTGAGGLVAHPKGGGVLAALTMSKWKFRIRCRL